MKNRTVVLIVSCFLASLTLVFVLFILSDDIVHRQNSFLRQFPPHPISPADTFDIKYNSYYLAGSATHHLYLGNYTAPLHMLVVNTVSRDTQHIKLNIKNFNKWKFKTINIQVDSPNFYVLDGTVPAIFKGTTKDWIADRYMYDSAYFTDAVIISPTSLAMRSLSLSTNEYILGKEQADTPYFRASHDLLEKQIDGRFCVDGMLHYDKSLNRLLYLYYYRNQYIVMDSNLNLLYRRKTIDTISRAQIKVATISSSASRTMSAPPLLVNKKSCVSGNLLIVNSNLLAKNEDKEIFDKTSVFDVYNIDDGTYKLSFYISDFNGKKVKYFQIFDNVFVTIFDRYLLTYNLTPFYFKEQ